MSLSPVSEWFDQLVRERRSIRAYRPEAPPADHIQAMLGCAVWAPSASNSRPFRFLELASPAIRRHLEQAMIAGRDRLLAGTAETKAMKALRNRIRVYWRYAEFMFQAPVLLAAGTVRSHTAFAEHLTAAGLREEGPQPETDRNLSLGMALMGLMLKAQTLGLGTCILTAPLIFMEPPQALPGQPDFQIKCFVTAGFPIEIPRPPAAPAMETFYRTI